MRVCHLCDNTLEGEYFRNIARGLSAAGIDLKLLQLTSGPPPSWLDRFPNVEFQSLSADSRTAYPSAVRRLRQFLKSEKVDLLQTHLFNSGAIGVYAGRALSTTQVVLMRHHTAVVRMLGTRFHVAADKWMAEKADRVITVSDAARRYMVEVDGIRRDDIEVVHIGIDADRWSVDEAERTRVRSELSIGDDEFAIGYLANLSPGKGHIELLKAFEEILRSVPNARLVFAGIGMPDDVLNYAMRFGNKVIFAGWRSDAAAFLSALDLFVQPSLSEAFSQVILESMAAGLPVIATDVGGAREVIEDGRNGVIVPPGDPTAIAREAVKLINENELRSKIAAAGAATIRDRFTATRMADRHIELYRRWTDKT